MEVALLFLEAIVQGNLYKFVAHISFLKSFFFFFLSKNNTFFQKRRGKIKQKFVFSKGFNTGFFYTRMAFFKFGEGKQEFRYKRK